VSITHAEIARRFDFHPAPTEEKRNEHTAIRQAFRQLADEVVERVPASREQALAVTLLEEAMFWANAGVARPAPEQRR
jgi:F420-0:gamma-glutamyl ligase